MTALVFTKCDGSPAKPGPHQSRREVVISGRRAFTVDIHAHCLVPEAMDLLGFRGAERFDLSIAKERRLADMDAQGIDVQAISINPFWYSAERDAAAEVVRLQNDTLAELCGQHPDRFVAFASVALQFPGLAIEQLETAIRKQGLRGVAVGTSVAGNAFSDPRFHPFWAKCEELGILVFIHPTSTPEIDLRLGSGKRAKSIMGNPLDTTVAIWHLIFGGTLDRRPGLKICLAHGGGYWASYAPRADYAIRLSPEEFSDGFPERMPSEYLRHLYCDSLVFTPEALRHLVAVCGSGQVVLGTDYPIPWQPEAVDHILSTPGLSDDEKIAILGGTAARLLGIDPVGPGRTEGGSGQGQEQRSG